VLETFGDEYAAYVTRTKLLVPGIRSMGKKMLPAGVSASSVRSMIVAVVDRGLR
jgi:hypothetical protein